MIDWVAVLEKMESGDYTRGDARAWRERAFDWGTCCIQGVPKASDGGPKDDELRRLGIKFWKAICREKPATARNILLKVHDRKIELMSDAGV